MSVLLRYENLICVSCFGRKSSFCSAVVDDIIPELYALATEKTYAEGRTILLEEDPADAVFVLRNGCTSISRLTVDGKRQILSFQFPGDFFGLTSEDTYHYSVTTLTEALVCRFDRKLLEDFIIQHPEVDRTLRFLQTRQLDSAYELLFSLGRKNAIQKLAAFIWFVSYRHRKLGLPDSPIHLSMARIDVADFLGLTIETISRTFTELREMGVIDTPDDAYDVHILDHQALREIGVVPVEPSSSHNTTVEYIPAKK